MSLIVQRHALVDEFLSAAGPFLGEHEPENNLLFAISSAVRVTPEAFADQLARGRRFFFLFTDLANPTSNKIYRTIGCEPVCDVDQVRFDAGA